MPFWLIGAALALVLAAAVELTTVAVAGRCAPPSPFGWSFGEAARAVGCEARRSRRTEIVP